MSTIFTRDSLHKSPRHHLLAVQNRPTRSTNDRCSVEQTQTSHHHAQAPYCHAQWSREQRNEITTLTSLMSIRAGERRLVSLASRVNSANTQPKASAPPPFAQVAQVPSEEEEPMAELCDTIGVTRYKDEHGMVAIPGEGLTVMLPCIGALRTWAPHYATPRSSDERNAFQAAPRRMLTGLGGVEWDTAHATSPSHLYELLPPSAWSTSSSPSWTRCLTRASSLAPA